MLATDIAKYFILAVTLHYSYSYVATQGSSLAIHIHLLLLYAIKFDHFRFCAWGMCSVELLFTFGDIMHVHLYPYALISCPVTLYVYILLYIFTCALIFFVLPIHYQFIHFIVYLKISLWTMQQKMTQFTFITA